MDAAPIRYSLNKRASVFLADDSDPFRRVSSQHFEGLRRCLCCVISLDAAGAEHISPPNGHMLPVAMPASDMPPVVCFRHQQGFAPAG